MSQSFAEIVDRIDQHDDAHAIYAAPHWSSASRAVVVAEPADGSSPEGVKGMTYLLGVGLAKEIVRAQRALSPGREPSVEAKCRAIIYYAVYDTSEPVTALEVTIGELEPKAPEPGRVIVLAAACWA
jgi:hypothetical protein